MQCKAYGHPTKEYLVHGVLPSKFLFISWHLPHVEAVQVEPELLRRRCAWDAIRPSLGQFPEFAHGLCQPYDGEGMLISLEM